MAKKHLPNRAIKELTAETDFFGHIDKGNAIVSFFKSNIDDLTDTNMFALYGKWGSGKSTLMKYIGTTLEENNYKSLYFPAWEFEKDDNLPLSLLHFISDETGSTKETVVKELIKDAFDVVKSIGKSVSFEIIPGVKISGKALITAGEKADVEREKELASVYNKTKEFKNKFKKAEQVIVKKTGAKKLIVFIDDLDRCDPENVLALLSSIKLFFTLSDNIIFFFGCDKEAISKAVKHKYGEIIKADEYLEKIIDLSFNMPNQISIHKLLEYYFPEKTNYLGYTGSTSVFLAEFFKSINFTNPRHLKKVLNKFEIVRNFKTQKNLPHSHLIPNIIIDNEGDLMETILTLFFIILYEFYPKTFEDVFDIDKKITNYAVAVAKSQNENSTNQNKYKLNNGIISLYGERAIFSKEGLKISLTNLAKNCDTQKLQRQGQYNDSNRVLNAFNNILACFTPSHIEHLDIGFIDGDFIKQFNSNNTEGDIICIEFCNYLIRRKDWVLKMNADYRIENFVEMCRIIL